MPVTSVDDAIRSVGERADALMADAPGRVTVAKIHNIDEVRLLRESRETLDRNELFAIQQAVVELRAHLAGIELPPEPIGATFGQKMSRLFDSITGQSNETSRFRQNPAEAFQSPDPPSKALLDAAEAWMIAAVSQDRLDTNVEALMRPWVEAEVLA